MNEDDNYGDSEHLSNLKSHIAGHPTLKYSSLPTVKHWSINYARACLEKEGLNKI